MTLRDPRERYLDFWQNRRHVNMMGKSVNMVLSPPRDGSPHPHLCLFYTPIRSSLHLSFGWLCSLFQPGVWSQDGLLALCILPWGSWWHWGLQAEQRCPWELWDSPWG